MIDNVKKKSKKPSKKRLDRAAQPTLIGTINVHPKGFAFVTPEDIQTHPQDIFIPKHLKGSAVDGDQVEVSLRPSRRPEKGPEGTVKSIVKRGREEVVGVVWLIDPKGDYVLYLPSLGSSKAALVKKTKTHLYQIGDRLLLKVTSWEDKSTSIRCKVVKKLGSIEDPITDVEMALYDFNIRNTFSKEVLKEATDYPPTVSAKELEGRRDLSHLECVTIDPDTAKDFDDALSVTRDENNYYHLGIHIADVSHYVTEGSLLDKEAKKRCNSVYFPGQCIPMLPESLSNHLCSLVEGEIRLTVSVLVELDSNAALRHCEIVKGYIKSRKRFTYGEAKKVLDGEKKSPHLTTLKHLHDLCLLLKAKRSKRGSVDLALPETVILVDPKGYAYDYSVVEYDITHQMVEECMLTANAIVAQSVVEKGLPGLFRIHEVPDQESMKEFYTLANGLGFPLPEDPTIEDIQKIFDQAKETPYIQQLSIGFIRSMKLAIYSHENIGHYGLALEYYSHFTSPIRRYCDLVLHRLLFKRAKPPNLELISRHCSDQERISAKAEMSVIALKKLRLLERYYRDDPHRIYSATITKVKPFAIYFEVAPLSIEGSLHISELGEDYYEYDSFSQRLIGKHTGECFKVGTTLSVNVTKVDLILVEALWTLLKPAKRQKRRRKKKPKKS